LHHFVEKAAYAANISGRRQYIKLEDLSTVRWASLVPCIVDGVIVTNQILATGGVSQSGVGVSTHGLQTQYCGCTEATGAFHLLFFPPFVEFVGCSIVLLLRHDRRKPRQNRLPHNETSKRQR